MNKEQLFNEVYKSNKDRIYRICCFYVNDLEDRHDLFQEVLTNIWKGLDRFEGRSKVSTWVFRIAVNTSLAFRKKHRAESTKIENARDEIHREWNQSLSEGEQEAIQKLHQAISGLNKIEKAIVSLMLEDVSQKVIAEVMGYSENNIRVRAHRIKQKLKAILIPQSHGN
ncbi:MAG: sigma-70 family RNA polymerase sigma factor [Cytophagales bacterium]|nr:sigma-70 family RNA polymerase sigma factor [Cytophagales bacterium]